MKITGLYIANVEEPTQAHKDKGAIDDGTRFEVTISMSSKELGITNAELTFRLKSLESSNLEMIKAKLLAMASIKFKSMEREILGG